jgi:hypothetical protein
MDRKKDAAKLSLFALTLELHLQGECLLFDVKNGQLTKPKSKAQEHKQEEQEQSTSEQEREQHHTQQQHPGAGAGAGARSTAGGVAQQQQHAARSSSSSSTAAAAASGSGPSSWVLGSLFCLHFDGLLSICSKSSKTFVLTLSTSGLAQASGKLLPPPNSVGTTSVDAHVGAEILAAHSRILVTCSGAA